jgi:hypothetical protein
MTHRLTMLLIALSLVVGGCATKSGSGALIGAGVGALIGQAAGGNTAGTLIGAGVGTGVGYLIGNEMDKSDAQKRSQATADELRPFSGTAWQLLSVNPPPNKGKPVKSLVARFNPNGRVGSTRTFEDGTFETADESYRVVGDTLIVNKPDYIINARYKLDGDRLYLESGDRSAVLKKI